MMATTMKSASASDGASIMLLCREEGEMIVAAVAVASMSAKELLGNLEITTGTKSHAYHLILCAKNNTTPKPP